jgi:hypothetical protein
MDKDRSTESILSGKEGTEESAKRSHQIVKLRDQSHRVRDSKRSRTNGHQGCSQWQRVVQVSEHQIGSIQRMEERVVVGVSGEIDD